MNEDNNKNNNSPKGDKNNKKQPIIMFLLFTMIAVFITTMIYNSAGGGTVEKVSYTEFLKLVEKNEVEKVDFDSSKINFTLTKDSDYKGKDTDQSRSNYYYQLTGQKLQKQYYAPFIDDEALLPLLKQHKVEIDAEISSGTASMVYNVLSFVLPLLILWGLFAFLMKRMGNGTMGVGKSNAKVYVQKRTGITFNDVAGQDEAKESLQEVVDFLHNPQKYTAIGAKLPKGALLVGPPGTGKTLLAKAVAGEAGVPFFSLAGSDFVEMFVGVGASRVRDLFKEAQKQAPCIIFIDEIDAIGKSRDSKFGGGNDEREQTLNQLLAEMDGFDTSKGLLVLAATNRPEVLDKALLRPGRFDRRIIVNRPDLKGREETLKVHSKDVPMDDTVDMHALALASAGLVGSDLANIINEAAIIAVKKKRKYVNQEDLFEAFELVAVGGKEKKDRVMSDNERKIVSYHEVGHALVSALQKNAEPVQKITIVPRTMGALGYTLQTPEEEKFLETKEELLTRIKTFTAGRVAEELIFESPTSGASNDIEQATAIARNMITRFGMSETFGMMGLATVESQYLDGRASLNCGDETASVIDKEVKKLIDACYQDAKRMLVENRDILDHIAGYLYKHETISGKEFMKIFRRMKNLPEDTEETTKPGNALEAVKEKKEIRPEDISDSSEFIAGYYEGEEDVKADEARAREESQEEPEVKPNGVGEAEWLNHSTDNADASSTGAGMNDESTFTDNSNNQ
jgi:cell division protease FtsH